MGSIWSVHWLFLTSRKDGYAFCCDIDIGYDLVHVTARIEDIADGEIMQQQKKYRIKNIKKCPDCLKLKFIFIEKYEFIDSDIGWLQTTNLRRHICEKCFDQKYLSEIWRRYYDN